MRTLAAVLATFASLGFAMHARTQPVPSFAHVFVFVFENKEYASVLGSGQAPDPSPQRSGLALTQGRKGDIHIACGQGDDRVASRLRSVARHVAGALAMPHDRDLVRPLLLHTHPGTLPAKVWGRETPPPGEWRSATRPWANYP